MFGRLEGNFK